MRYARALLVAVAAAALAGGSCLHHKLAKEPDWCSGSDDRPCRVAVSHGPDEQVRSVRVPAGGRPLFELAPATACDPEAALAALRAYLTEKQVLFFRRRPPDLAPEDFSELSPAAVPPAAASGLCTLRFEQRHRGLPVVGPARELRLATVGGKVFAITGTPLDPRTTLRDRKYPGAPERVRHAAARAARERLADGGVRVDAIRRVAVPHRRTVGYEATLVSDVEPPYVVARLLLGASDLKVLTVQPERRELGATVRARQMGSDPTTTGQTDFDELRALIPRPNEIQFEDGEARHAYRLGSDLRVGVLDFGGGAPDAENAQFREELGGTNFSPPAPEFTSQSGDAFQIQDRYQKLWAALDVLDPMVGEVGWEHDAGIAAAAPPPIIRPAELLLLYDTPCQGPSGPAPGVTSSTVVDQAAQELLDLPHFSPWHQLASAQPGSCGTDSDCNAHLDCQDGDCVGEPSFYMSTVNVCVDDDAFVLFHELGHYLDRHLALGFLRAVDGEQCVADTSDEAAALGETVANLTGLYLLRRLYPDLPYTLDTLDGGCSFSPVDSRLGSVIHDDCPPGTGESALEYVRNFQCERPDTPAIEDEFDGCGYNFGYTQAGIFQAWWQLLNGQHCEFEVGGGFMGQTIESVSCTDVSTGSGYEDRWMGLLLYALAQGNQSTYDELFDHIAGTALFIHLLDPTVIRTEDLELLGNVRDNHSIGSETDYPSPAFLGLCPGSIEGGG